MSIRDTDVLSGRDLFVALSVVMCLLFVLDYAREGSHTRA